MKFNYYFYNFSSILLVLIPFFLITGPLLSDLSITLIGLIFLLNCIKNKNFYYFQNLYFYIFIVFYLLICFSSFISDYNYYSLKPSITYIRFALFAIASYVIISINQRCLLYLTKLFVSIIVVLLIDSSVQLLFGNNLLGWEVEGVNFRITSFFGDDEVLGSYIARFLPLIIALIIYCKDNLNFKFNDNLFYIIFFSCAFICFISGERTSFFLMLLSLVIILLTVKRLRRILLLSLVITFLSSLFVIFTNENVKERMVNQTFNQMGFFENSDRLIIFSKIHESHYKVSINMFKEKPIFGHGPKSFRKYCSQPENFVAKHACTTHPHNIYMQLISETGLLGFLIILFVFIIICFKLAKIFFINLFFKENKFNDSFTLILIFYFINLFPFAPSGNFFNNWISIVYYLPSGYIIYLNSNLKRK